MNILPQTAQNLRDDTVTVDIGDVVVSRMSPLDFHRTVIAGLVAHALGHLDGWPDPEDEEGCCPQCCAPCHSLKLLADEDMLDAAVKPFVEETGADWVWWVDGRVDPEWLARGWRGPWPCHE